MAIRSVVRKSEEENRTAVSLFTFRTGPDSAQCLHIHLFADLFLYGETNCSNLHSPHESRPLRELEASAQDIVLLRVYVVNATSEAFGQAVTPIRELLGDAMPSITTIGVQALYKPDIKVEFKWWCVSPKRAKYDYRTIPISASPGVRTVDASIQAPRLPVWHPAYHSPPHLLLGKKAPLKSSYRLYVGRDTFLKPVLIVGE